VSIDKPGTVAESIAQAIRARYETAADTQTTHVM
jgi:hypothetical protein